jgi:hypothetical protein
LLENIECSLYTKEKKLLRQLTTWFDNLFFEHASAITASGIEAYEPYHQRAKRRAGEMRKAGLRFDSDLGRARKSAAKRALKGAPTTRGEFFYVNTDIRYDERAHHQMLDEGQACAFYETKQLIDRIPGEAVVFLYRSSRWGRSIPGRPGIVALGRATGEVEKRPYKGHTGEAHCMRLEGFRQLIPPIAASEINELNRRVRGSKMVFSGTSNKIDGKLGRKLYELALQRSA